MTRGAAFRPVIPSPRCAASPSCSSAARPRPSRCKAFRRAADALLALDAEEVRRRADAGSLREIEGIGKATEAVVVETLAGQTSTYLADLETGAGPLAPGGAEVRAALRGDLHTHSDWSDGGSPIEEMVMTAVELGHEYVALTDHSPRLKVANGLSAARLTKQLGVLEAVNGHLGRAADAGAARASRSTSSTTAAWTRPRSCSTGSTSWWPRCTASCGWSPGR